MNFLCKRCGHKWKSQAREQVGIHARGCPFCNEKNNKKAFKRRFGKKFQKRITKKFHNNILCKSPYVSCNTRMLFACVKCGKSWKRFPENELSSIGNGCPYCSKEIIGKHKKIAGIRKRKKLSKSFNKKVMKYSHGTIKPLWRYRSSKRPMKYKCMICGYIWISKRSKWDNVHCMACAIHKRNISNSVHYDEFAKELNKKWNGKIKCLKNTFKLGRRSRIEFECQYGHKWWSTQEYMVKNPKCTGCPYCNKRNKSTLSNMEEATKIYLKSNNIKYICGYKAKWLGNLHLDFYLPNIRVAIEDDGIQHFEPVEFFGGKKRYPSRHQNDLNKDKLCFNNGVLLIRIKDFHDISGYKRKATKLVTKILDLKLMPIVDSFRLHRKLL